jgi:EmrB/QacA subfamily drug resistance transporter
MDNESRKKLTLATMCIATFMAILDTTVVNLALHSIQVDLRVSVTGLQWVLDIYNLVYAGFILTGGVLGDLFGRRRVFAIGIALFTAGSLVCALAPDAGILILGRGISGLGAALQLPGALSILTVTFQKTGERARAIAIWGSFNGLAMAVGPTLGGLLVDYFGWRSIFFLVVPFGVMALVLAFTSVNESANPEGRRIDLAGQATSILALGLLSFAFIQAPSIGWRSPLIVGSVVGCVVSFAALLKVESAGQGSMVSLEIFRNRAFSVAIANAAMMTFGFYTLLFIFPLYLQALRGNSAVVAGLKLLPLSLTFFLMSPVAGMLLPRVGARALITLGLGLFGVGLWGLALFSSTTSYVAMLPALITIGLGNALCFGPIMNVAVSNVGHERSGMSSGLVNVARMVGATLAVAIAGSIFKAQAQAGREAAGFLLGMRRAFFVAGLDEVLGGLIALVLLGSAARQILNRPEGQGMGKDSRAA